MTCAVADVRGSTVQSVHRSGKARPPTTESFHNNSYAHDDQGDNPGQEIERSTVFTKNCYRRWHLHKQRQGVNRADVVEAGRCG